MKITGQSVPTQYAAQMKTYLTFADAVPATTATARTNSGLARATVSRRAKRLPTDFEAAADYIAKDQRRNGTVASYADLYTSILANLKTGVFDAPYWIECAVSEPIVYRNYPTSAPRLITKPYAYRDPLNLPTIPTYGTGAESIMPLRYQGTQQGGYFEDFLLRWAIYVATMPRLLPLPIAAPVFWKIEGAMTASASTRGARPMLALISKVQRCMLNEPPTYSELPPVDNPRYINVRYKLPPAAPPFWSRQGTIQAVITAAEKDADTTAPEFDAAVLRLAPAPMFGQWFNNNSYVYTQIEPEVTCYAYDNGGWVDFTANLPLNNFHTFADCGTIYNPCAGFLTDDAQSSVSVPGKFLGLITHVRNEATGHTESVYASWVAPVISPPPPYVPPPDPQPTNDPFGALPRMFLVGSAGTLFMIVIGNSAEPYNPEAFYSSMIRLTGGASETWWPPFTSIQVKIQGRP